MVKIMMVIVCVQVSVLVCLVLHLHGFQPINKDNMSIPSPYTLDAVDCDCFFNTFSVAFVFAVIENSQNTSFNNDFLQYAE